MKEIKLYWSHSKPNFGDAMSPLICERLSGRSVVHASKRTCDLVAVGSLLDRFKERFFHPRVNVWGTGFIEDGQPRSSRFHYHAVRGRYSVDLVRGQSINTFGDPGLLADVLWPELRGGKKSHRIGIVPHYKDRGEKMVKDLANSLKSSFIIDVFGDVTDVLRQIASCDCVLSSSLHGLIIADSFGIPNARIKLSDKVRGKDFKFKDYYSIFDLEYLAVALDPAQINEGVLDHIIQSHDRPGVDLIKDRLIEAFPFL
ncbi:MAG: polysaccharide pyruvyl transferase family protein [Verrucomicrobiae bacterium]|nr:polysaccharide pyruvyl transferase family protein [Verrucomicrobiae bacterium]NNJ43707.1 polysaccharide pyruvyl transferase family protein [Akkermansiaceae bacterium]